MSHLDELDEFEADAKLRLKKEYAAVFSLFRYCVLTQDAPLYLCNRLDLQYVPGRNYPFFHLKMEDVWVWDQEPSDAHDPACRGLHLGGRIGRGASRRRRSGALGRGLAERMRERFRRTTRSKGSESYGLVAGGTSDLPKDQRGRCRASPAARL